MRNKINLAHFDTIFSGLNHLKLEEDHQALLSVMILLANNNSPAEKWSWLNFATLVYGARKNAKTRRWFYNTKDGTKLTKAQLLPYYDALKVWEANGWITLVDTRYDGSLNKGVAWSPLPVPKIGDITTKYIINLNNIETYGIIPTNKLF
mgnify:CR=1 FL=1